jgi:hypothetical protein
MVARSRSGNKLHFAWARCRLTVPGWQPAAKSFLISSIWVCGWCFGGSCSSATNAVANASVTTHSSWPVIPFLGISPSPRLVSPVNRATPEQRVGLVANFHTTIRAIDHQRKMQMATSCAWSIRSVFSGETLPDRPPDTPNVRRDLSRLGQLPPPYGCLSARNHPYE